MQRATTSAMHGLGAAALGRGLTGPSGTAAVPRQRDRTLAVSSSMERKPGMNDPTDDAPEKETPIQRAMRLKKAAHVAKSQSRKEGWGDRERAAAAKSASKSKPWMSR